MFLASGRLTATFPPTLLSTCEQGGWNLHESKATGIRRCDKAREIPNDTATYGDHPGRTISAQIQQLLPELIGNRDTLCRLTRSNDDHVNREAAVGKALGNGRCVWRLYVIVGDHDGMRGSPGMLDPCGGLIEPL